MEPGKHLNTSLVQGIYLLKVASYFHPLKHRLMHSISLYTPLDEDGYFIKFNMIAKQTSEYIIIVINYIVIIQKAFTP